MSSTIGDISITEHCGHGRTISILNLRRTEGYNWASELSLSANANIYGAVIAQNGMLVNVEDYVAFCDDKLDKVQCNNNC